MGRRAPPSRGIGGTLPGRISLVRNVETPSGSRCRKAPGRPTVREVELPGGTGRPKKRMPAAERRQETGTPWPALPLVVPAQLAGYGPMPGPERVLTWVG